MQDEYFMRIALEEANRCIAEDIFPVGSLLVLNHEDILATAKKISHSHLGHPEIIVLNEAFAKRGFKKGDVLTLYTSIEPCLMCYGTILHTNINKIVFALEDPWAGATGLESTVLPPRYGNLRPKILGGVLRKESIEILKEYAKSTNNQMWKDTNNPLVRLVQSS